MASHTIHSIPTSFSFAVVIVGVVAEVQQVLFEIKTFGVDVCVVVVLIAVHSYVLVASLFFYFVIFPSIFVSFNSFHF